jgi:hypothetical protein
MTARVEIAIAAFFLAVGTAGPPLEPLRILGALVVCAAVALGTRFMAAIALVAVVLAGWLQHGQLRLTLLAAAALLGIVVRFWGSSPRAATVICAVSAATGLAWLFLG